MAQSIRFPRMHMAASVTNRILNIADGMPLPQPSLAAPPTLPDIEQQGEVLDAQLETPLTPTELPAGADGAVVDAALGGENLATASVSPLTGI